MFLCKRKIVFTFSQDPPYSTGTEAEFEIDIEPKLDDSVLQWDDELEDNGTLTLGVSPRDSRLSVSVLNYCHHHGPVRDGRIITSRKCQSLPNGYQMVRSITV